MKTPTSWVTNTQADANRYPFDNASIKFDNSNRTYDGVTTGESSFTTLDPINWTNTTNQSTGTTWLTNPDAYANTDPYDTSGVYDTTGNYDAVVAGESFITTAQPITWTSV